MTTYTQEIQAGATTYHLGISAEGSKDMTVEIHATTHGGAVVADGQLRFPAADGVAIGKSIAQAVTAQSRLMARKPKASNANAPWTKGLDSALRTAWLELSPSDDASKCIRKLAADMERSATAIRARLPRTGCDPDVPGRELSESARDLFKVQ